MKKPVNELKKEDRQKIITLIKSLELTVKQVEGFNKAMVTAGGVDLKEVDPQTMRSKIIENLFFAGEVLDLDGPTGGYNLQIAWSTAAIAASSKFKM